MINILVVIFVVAVFLVGSLVAVAAFLKRGLQKDYNHLVVFNPENKRVEDHVFIFEHSD